MKTTRFLAIALSIVMIFSLFPHAFAMEDLAALQAELARQQAEYQQQMQAAQAAAQQELAQAQQDYTQQVQQAQADAQRAYKQATCKHEWTRVVEEDPDPDDGVHDEVTVCVDCEKELDRKTVEDKKEEEPEPTRAMAMKAALRAAGEVVASGTCGEDLTWTLDSNGTLTISGTGAMTNYINDTDVPWYSSRESITSVVIEDGVTTIGSRVFYVCISLTSVTIPNSVTSIRDAAFYNCTSLTSVTIGSGVTSIRENAFNGCSGLTSVIFESGSILSTIGTYAFYGCIGLTSVTIPNSVTSIGDCAFQLCTGLTSVTIGSGVTSIGASAFAGTGLTDVWAENVALNVSNAGIPEKAVHKPYTVTTGVNPAYSGKVEAGKASDIPTCPDEKYWSNTEVTLTVTPDTGYALDTLTYKYTPTGGSETTETIDTTKTPYTFTMPAAPVTVTATFKMATLTGTCGDNLTWTLENGVLTITGTGAMYDYASIDAVPWSGVRDSITKVVINGATTIGNNAFRGCTSLTDVTIPSTVTSIGNNAFMRCKIESVTIPNSVTSIGNDAFHACGFLTSVTFEANSQLESIESSVFRECGRLTSITIPNSVTSIEGGAFFSCGSLKSVIIPNSVNSMGRDAFDGDTKIYFVGVKSSCQFILNSLGNGDRIYCLPYNYILLSSDPSEGGSARFSSYTYVSIEKGVSVNMTAKANPGYSFVNWTDDKGVVGTDPALGYIVPFAKMGEVDDSSFLTLTAHYTKASYTVSCAQAEHGSVTPSQDTAEMGNEITLTVTPDTGYALESLTVTDAGGNPVTVTDNKFTMPAANVTVTATFKLKSFTITWQDDEGKTIDTTTVEYGTVPTHANPTKQATAQYTYTFAGWDPEPVAAAGDATYKAKFTAKEIVPPEPEKGTYYFDTELFTTSWKKNSGVPAYFRVHRDPHDEWAYPRFTGILMDGAAVSSGNYAAAEGSVIIAVSPAYLQTLPTGWHTITALFNDDGRADARFLIVPADNGGGNNSGSGNQYYIPSNVPRTGDDSHLALWGALACLSAAGAVLMAKKRKRREH